MDDSDTVLQHTVSSPSAATPRRVEKGIIGTVRHLSRDIGFRTAGSKGERRAARFVEKELESLGISVETQRFHAPSTVAWSKMLSHLVPVAGALVFPANAILSYLLILFGFLFFLLEGFGRSPLAWATPRLQSENVIARISPAGEPETRLVVIAHLDSPRSAFYYRPGIVRLLRSLYLLDAACQVALFMLFTVAFGGQLLSMERSRLYFLWHVGLVLATPLFLAMLAIFSKAVSGQETPGGNHNASGVAVLLELARIYSRHQLHKAELWLAFTGASEVSAYGARKMVRRHRRQLRDTYFIVLEGVGRGFPACCSREGRLIPFRANRRLLGLAKRTSQAYIHHGTGLVKNNLYLGEGFHLLSRGHKAITLCSREEDSIPRFWRWVKDDHLNVDPRSLRMSLEFLRAMVDAVDHGSFTKRGGRVRKGAARRPPRSSVSGLRDEM